MEDADACSMSAVKEKAKQILSICEYAGSKILLSDAMVEAYNEYMTKAANLVGLANRVIRSDVTKENALQDVNEVFELNGDATAKTIAFLNKEHTEAPYEGLQTLFGDAFVNAVDDAAIMACMIEAEEINLEVVLRVNPNIESRVDIPLLEAGFTEVMNLYTEVKNTKVEAEDTSPETLQKSQ